MFSYSKVIYIIATLLAVIAIVVSRDAQSALFWSKVLANLAFLALYLTLLPSALYATWKGTPGRLWLARYRKTHGITAFILSAGHANLSLYKVVGGPEILLASDSDFRMAVFAGMFAFNILIILALTSFSKAIKLLGKWWKTLHRLAYIAGLLIFVHVLLIKTYYSDQYSLMSIGTIFLCSLLLILESIRFYKYARRKIMALFNGKNKMVI
jgi:DMSO/TMAO reductase YedYZ heme-binding membrane subunit